MPSGGVDTRARTHAHSLIICMYVCCCVCKYVWGTLFFLCQTFIRYVYATLPLAACKANKANFLFIPQECEYVCEYVHVCMYVCLCLYLCSHARERYCLLVSGSLILNFFHCESFLPTVQGCFFFT